MKGLSKELDILFQQMKEYLEMKELLPFADFNAYYRRVTDYLQTNYQDMDEDGLVAARGICNILAQNSRGRAGLDRDNRKKFQKIESKTNFWADAIALRLKKENGMDTETLEAREKALWETAEAADNPVLVE